VKLQQLCFFFDVAMCHVRSTHSRFDAWTA